MHYDLVGEVGAGPGVKTEHGVSDSDGVEEVEAPSKDDAEVVDLSEEVVSPASEEVMSPADYKTLHMKGGGLSSGNFTLAYWKAVKTLEVELPEPCPVVMFRTMERSDFHKKEWKLTTLPKHRVGPGATEYSRYRKHFRAMKVVGVDEDGQVYRPYDKDIEATSPFPPGFTGAMYAQAVELLFETKEKKTHEKQEAKKAKRAAEARRAAEEKEEEEEEEEAEKEREREARRSEEKRKKKAAEEERAEAENEARRSEEKRKKKAAFEQCKKHKAEAPIRLPNHDLYNQQAPLAPPPVPTSEIVGEAIAKAISAVNGVNMP